MNTTIQSIHLDLEGSSMPPTVNIQKGDNKKILRISLWNGLRRYQLTPDIWPVLSAKKPDGSSLYNVCEIQDNEIIYHFTEQTSNCLGLMRAELKLYGGNQQLITTMYFFIAVHETIFQADDAAKSKDEQTALDALVNRTQQQALILNQKLENGEFNGDSAYDIAVRLGYSGTESQWLQSLRYDHSDEFTVLSQQAVDASAAAQQSAVEAKNASEAATQCVKETHISAAEAVTAAGEARDQAQLAAASAESAAQAEKAASAYAEASKKQAVSSILSASEAKKDADRAAEVLTEAATKQDAGNALTRTVTGEIIALDDVSPLPHRIDCQVKSRNLFHISTAKLMGLSYENGVFTTTQTDTADDLGFKIVLFKQSRILESTEQRFGEIGRHSLSITAQEDADIIWFSNIGKTVQSNLEIPVEIKQGQTITVSFTLLTAGVNTWSYRDVQIEYGRNASPYTEGISDLSTVVIHQYGKNLCPENLWPDWFEKQPDGSYHSTRNFVFGEPGVRVPMHLPAGKIYTLSCLMKTPPKARYCFKFEYSDGTRGGNALECNGEYREYTVTSNGKEIVAIQPDYWEPTNDIFFKNLQIEVSPTKTAFKKHTFSALTPNKLGVIPDFPFLYPYMTLIAQTPGTAIDFYYHQDINTVLQKVLQRISDLENSQTTLN